MNRYLILLLTILFTFRSFPQTTDIQTEKWRDVLSELIDDENYQQDINDVINSLSELINNPILINICTKRELEQIPFLSDDQIENLLYYLYVFGEMKSIHELRLVEGFDLATIELVRPFFRVQPRVAAENRSANGWLRNARSQLILRMDAGFDRKEGYIPKSDSLLLLNPDKQYLGSPYYYSLRYRLENKQHFRVGFMLEKDAGEKGLDYFNGFLQLRNKGILRNLVVGSFKMRYGAGLILNNAFSLGKNSTEANSILRNNGITPHASADEYNYLTGIAAELIYRNVRFIPFWSMRSIGGRVSNDTLRSIKKDGLYRLPRDRDVRHQANLFSTGLRISVKGSFYEVALNGCYHVSDKVYAPDLRLYNRYVFRGKESGNLSVDYRFRKQQLSFAGETAMSMNGRLATLNVFTLEATSDLSLTLLQRYYDKAYQTWFGRGFAEGSELCNESGVALYLRWKPIAGWSMNGGFDLFRFPWAKYGVDAPSSGYEISYQTTYQQQEKLAVSLRYRLKNKEKNRSGMPDSIFRIQGYQQHTLNLKITSRIGHFFFLTTGADAVFAAYKNESPAKGFMLSQRIGFKASHVPLQVDLGVALFETDGTTVKVYLSEKNVLYGFGIPSFYGNGMRYSCNLRYDYGSRISCWIKYAGTSYFDRDEIGTGLERICGKNKNDLQVQLQFKF